MINKSFISCHSKKDNLVITFDEGEISVLLVNDKELRLNFVSVLWFRIYIIHVCHVYVNTSKKFGNCFHNSLKFTVERK